MTRLIKLVVRHRPQGQVLVLTALLLVILIGLTGLAIDVSAAYLTERRERTVADAAALAGAQSLQKPGTRSLPEEAERVQARANAMHVLTRELGASATPADASCFTSVGCEMPGTPYFVSVQTPSPSCRECAPRRSMQVSIWQPDFGVAFARIFGDLNWTVRSTSVAGMVIAPQYGIVTLRPSAYRPNDSDANYADLSVNGNTTKVVVGNADIATNSNATCSGDGAEIVVDTAAGFDIHHFGSGPYWTSPPGDCANPPPGFQLTTLVDDPVYPIPSRSGSITYRDDSAGRAAALADPAVCEAHQLLVPDAYEELNTDQTINDPTATNVTCYKPGIYEFKLTVQDPASGLPNVALLLPGVYFFDAGLEVTSTIIGGYLPEQPGVALVFQEAKNSSGIPGQFITKTKDSLVALNFGTAYCPSGSCPAGAKWANPADGPEGPVQTPGPNSTLLTLMVVPDQDCVVVSPPSSSCRENDNQTLKLTGGGNIFLAGVQYAPSDNATLTGSSGQESDIGAFWAWTLEFNGGTTFNLASLIPQSAGVLRIDSACSPTLRSPPHCNP